MREIVMNTINTAEQVGEENYAGIWARVGAYLADCLILFAGLIVWQAGLYSVNPLVAIIRGGGQPTGGQLYLWVFATATLPYLLYFVLTQGSARQATLGMRWLGLKVGDLNGKRIGYGRALLRGAVMFVPFEANHAVMFYLSPRGDAAALPSPAFWLGYVGVWILIGIYIASVLLTRRRQSLHDLAAATVVLKIKS